MGIILASLRNKRTKIKTIGKTLNLLTLLVATSRCLAERISKERGVSLEEAENIVSDCVKDGMKRVHEYP